MFLVGDKMSKKNKKLNNSKKNINTNSMVSTDNEMSKLILLILIVAVVFVAFYVVTLFVTKNEEKQETQTEENYEATIQYEKILAGNILSKENSEYYVLVYYGNDKYVDLYKNYLTYYEATVEGAVPFYYVDMDDVFNSSFISDKSKLNVSDAKDFKFKETTLLRIQNGKVISTYEGKDNITGKLGRMTK